MTEVFKQRKSNILHIYNRGNRKEEICKDQQDYIFLFNLFLYYFSENKFDLITFCIMPNHFHILAKQKGNVHISKIMHIINSRYTNYINWRHSLVGHLYQGTYKAKIVVNKDQYFIVSKYIFNNLGKIGIENEYPRYFSNEILFGYYALDFYEAITQTYSNEI